ncbi:MAG: transglutaminaseTgpA domain-containing protein [Nocardioidaceae bacterium]
MTLAEQHRVAVFGWLATVAMSWSFFPALSDKRFLVFGILASAAVFAVGMLLRQLRVPSVAVLLVQLLVVIETLAVSFGGHTRYGLIPTPSTFRSVRELVTSGFDVANKYAAPVPHSPGLVMVVVFFIAVVAALVDFIAVALSRVSLAGLPLLTLYVVPVAALPQGLSVIYFIPGAVGYIALLMVSERERLGHWGRLIAAGTPRARSEAIDTSGLASAGRRISFFALATAVIVPLLIPGFQARLFGNGGSGIGPGGGSLTFADPMVTLAESLRRTQSVDLLSVRSDVPPEYLRMAVLDQPGPDGWRAQPVDLAQTVPLPAPLPAPTGLSQEVASTPHSLTISPLPDFPRDSTWLPVPFDLSSVSVGPGWNFVPRDQTVTSTDGSAPVALDSYTTVFSSVEPTEQQLASAGRPPSDIMSTYGTVPSGVPAIVTKTARAVTASATSDYQRAVLLQSFFRDSQLFSYDVSVGYGYGYGAMVQFLDQRRGFCQQFAATMAMMARTVGIPSRIVVGFLHPRQASDGYVFTSHDAHSWPELYFQGVGWVRFEPTPGVGAGAPGYAPIQPLPGSAKIPGVTKTSAPGVQGRLPNELNATKTLTQAHAGSGSSSGGPPSKLWLVLVGLLIVALLPALARVGVRRSRLTRPVDKSGSGAAESAWLELRDHLRDLHLPWSGSLTPRAREKAVGPLLGGDQRGLAALRRLADSVERSRYAIAPLAQATPAADAQEVMAMISCGVDWPRRIRAIVWPASLIPEIRAGLDKISSRRPRSSTSRSS